MCTLGRWLVAGNTADQIGDLVIKAIREDGICAFSNRVANDARFGDPRQARGLAQARFSSRIKANTFHDRYCITFGEQM
ncbi:MAG TPA: hypothetical protein VG104_07855 [Candidatus Dormibacteraeota bacterium]|nr:hypothetical protein [Candidatus Dormibacteraeota bacterium]